MLGSESKADEVQWPASQCRHPTGADGVTPDQAAKLFGGKPALDSVALAQYFRKSHEQFDVAAQYIPRQTKEVSALTLKLGGLAAPAQGVDEMPEVAGRGVERHQQ